MAKVIDKFTGSFSGQLGDMVYRRYKNGSVFVARQKSVNTVSYSDKCIKTRNNFKVAVAFAKAANLLPDIRAIWKSSAYEGRSPYTKILKTNINLVNKNSLPGATSMLTPKGFGFNVYILSLNKDKISLSISLPAFYKSMMNINLNLNFLLALYNPKNPDSNADFICIADSSKIVFTDFDNFHTYVLDFNTMNRKTLSEFQNAIVFLSLTNTEDSKHIFSGTFHSQAQISE